MGTDGGRLGHFLNSRTRDGTAQQFLTYARYARNVYVSYQQCYPI